jgi:hypothetical protein
MATMSDPVAALRELVPADAMVVGEAIGRAISVTAGCVTTSGGPGATETTPRRRDPAWCNARRVWRKAAEPG